MIALGRVIVPAGFSTNVAAKSDGFAKCNTGIFRNASFYIASMGFRPLPPAWSDQVDAMRRGAP